MLWGGGAPFKVINPASELQDRSNNRVVLLGAIGDILHELSTAEEWEGVKIAWVSCTDEPSWANECLEKFVTAGGASLKSVCHSEQIYKANKVDHFKQLRALFPEIEYDDMIFF